jgi:hypothetical protein
MREYGLPSIRIAVNSGLEQYPPNAPGKLTAVIAANLFRRAQKVPARGEVEDRAGRRIKKRLSGK